MGGIKTLHKSFWKRLSKLPWFNNNKARADIEAILNSIREYELENDPIFDIELHNASDYEAAYNKYKNIFFRNDLINQLARIRISRAKILYYYPAFCDVCDKETNFILEAQWGTSTEGLVCPECKINSRLRNIYRFIRNTYKSGMSVYISEQSTSFFSHLKKKIPELIGSEYDPEGRLQGIRHEDITKLSFTDNSLDLYISNDVFEHVFDYKQAFAEASRVLRDKGVLLFHVPFFLCRSNTKIRARLKPDGSIEMLEKAMYHGNPISNEGSLWINEFGWDMLDTLKRFGFAQAYAVLSHDVHRGLLNDSALVFVAKN